MPSKKTVLLVEDNEINMMILEGILQPVYNILKAFNGKEALEIVENNKEKISIILTDINMPVMDGYTFIKELKGNELYRQIPIVVMTQNDSEDEEIAALKCGANDFLPKPYRAEVILHRIKNIISLVENVYMVKMIHKDSLTGLYTKEYFYSKTREIIDNDNENDYLLVCSNIDNFKLYIDIFGQKAGNDLLISISKYLKRLAPKNALWARLEADRFVILIKSIYEDKCRKIVSFFQKNNQFNNFSIHWGIYRIIDRSIDIKLMCERAKLACDSIKGQFDVSVAEYDDKLRERILREMSIGETMEKSLKNNEFIFYLQSKVDIKTNKIIGAEALVRWMHPKFGIVPPNDFIPLFEKNGFITFLDKYICEQVFIYLENLKKENIPLVPISINFSRIDFFKMDIVSFLKSLLDKYDVEAKYIHLELTESTYIENTSHINEAIKELRKLNFVIEMDDFGSGYSSLNMFSQIEIDIIKLDRLFIQKELESDVGGNIISFIISLAHKLNIEVVAEGVETYQQMIALQNMNCDYAQGYYFSRPIDNNLFKELLLSMKKSNILQEKEKVVSLKNKILLIDDDKNNHVSIIKDYLSKDYDVIVSKEEQEILNHINSYGSNIVIILINYALPTINNDVVLSNIRHNSYIWEIPIIALLDRPNSYDESAVINYCDDFICKCHPLSDLLRRIKTSIYNCKLKRDYITLQEEANHDYTTNLLNRRGLNYCIDRIGRKDYPLAVYLYDIDNLKRINDTQGHSYGDKMILTFSNVIKNNHSDKDILCRYGGDEFLVISFNVDNEEEVLNKGEFICQEIHRADENASCSCGAIILDENQSIVALSIDDVDKVLYKAKKSKKGHCVLASRKEKENVM